MTPRTTPRSPQKNQKVTPDYYAFKAVHWCTAKSSFFQWAQIMSPHPNHVVTLIPLSLWLLLQCMYHKNTTLIPRNIPSSQRPTPGQTEPAGCHVPRSKVTSNTTTTVLPTKGGSCYSLREIHNTWNHSSPLSSYFWVISLIVNSLTTLSQQL